MRRSLAAMVLAGCAAPPPEATAPARLEVPALPDLPCSLRAEAQVVFAGVPVRSAASHAWTVVLLTDHLRALGADGIVRVWHPPGVGRDLAVRGDVAWVAADRAGLVRLDLRSGEVRTWPLPAPARAVAVAGSAVWVGDDAGSLWRVEGDRMDPTAIDMDIERLVADAGGVWVTDRMHRDVLAVGAPTTPAPDPETPPPPADPDHVAAVGVPLTSAWTGGPSAGLVSAEAWGGGLLAGIAGEAGGAVIPVGVDGAWTLLDGPLVDLAVRDDVVAAATLDRRYLVDVQAGRAEPLPPVPAAFLTAIAWAPDGHLDVVDLNQGLLPASPSSDAYRRYLDLVHLGDAAVVSLGFEGRLQWHRQGHVERTALPSPAARAAGTLDEGRLRVHGGQVWVPMPEWGLARVAGDGSTQAARLPTGAFDTAATDDAMAVALGAGGVGLVDPDTLALVARCPLPGEITRVVATPSGLWALSSGVATALR